MNIKNILDKIEIIKNNDKRIFDLGKLRTLSTSKYIYPIISGETVILDGINPIKHELKIKLSSKNLIPPYNRASEEKDGVKFTHNTDGSITVSGTPTEGNVVHYFSWYIPDTLILPFDKYTISGVPSGASETTYSMNLTAFETVESLTSNSRKDYGIYGNKTFDLAGIAALAIIIRKGYTANNLVFKPQIEKGTTATPWSPYISDFSEVNVYHTTGDNLSPVDVWTTKDNWLGNLYCYTSTAGTYYFSADITRYEDDTIGLNRRITLDVFCADGTHVRKDIAAGEIPNDGITRRFRTTISTNGKEVEKIRLILFRGENTGRTNSKAENIKLYLLSSPYCPLENGEVEGMMSNSPNMELTTDADDGSVIINCQYYKELDPYIDSLIENTSI